MKRIRVWASVVVVCVLASVGASAARGQERDPQRKTKRAAKVERFIAAEPELPRGETALPAIPQGAVPRLIKFTGALADDAGEVRSGTVGLTFAIYNEQRGGAPLWLETQTVALDDQGRYTILLGATKNDGIPVELFTTNEARWLGVQVELPGETEQPRVLLVSVPYALKAADAETLGGKPASAYALVESLKDSGGGTRPSEGRREPGISAARAGTEAVVGTITGEGTTGRLAKFTGGNSIGDAAVLFESNSKIGIGTTTPGAQLDLTGDLGFAGNAEPTATGRVQMFDRAFAGFVIRGLNTIFETLQPNPTEVLRIASSGNVGIGTNNPGTKLDVSGVTRAQAYQFSGNLAAPSDATATIFDQANVGPTFSGLSFSVRTGSTPAARLTIDPVGNVGLGTTAPSAKLEVAGNMKLTGQGNAIIFPDGTVMSTAGAGGGGGTITGVTAGTGLSGGGSSGNVTLNNAGVLTFNGRSGAVSPASNDYSFAQLSGTATKAQLPATTVFTDQPNTLVGTQTISGNLSLTGLLSLPATASGGTAGVITLGGSRFAHAFGTSNTFLGAGAGNFTLSGGSNTAVGSSALQANTTGFENTALGASALVNNTTGTENTAVGTGALGTNITGTLSTAVGRSALSFSTACCNTALGAQALRANTTGATNVAVGRLALDANTTASDNTAVGDAALASNTTGTNNTAVGRLAGSNLTSGNNNIYIGSVGPPSPGSESGVIRIGTSGTHSTAAIAGTVQAAAFQGDGSALTVSGTNVAALVQRLQALEKELACAPGCHLLSKRIGGTDSDSGIAVAADANGDIFVTGNFRGTVDFGGGNLTAHAGVFDIFVAKYSGVTGAHLWSKNFGKDTFASSGRALAVNTSGDVIVTGFFTGPVDFGGGPIGDQTHAAQDIFVVKLSGATGAHIWSKAYGTQSSASFGEGVAVDASGNVFVTGFFQETVAFGGGLGQTLSSNGAEDIFLLTLSDSDGSTIRAAGFGGTGSDIGRAVAVDSNGNVFITGSFEGTVTFGLTPSLVSAGSSDVFVVKFTPLPAVASSTKFGSTSADEGLGIGVDPAGNPVVTGSFQGTVNFGFGSVTSAGLRDIFVLNFTSTVSLTGVNTFGSTGTDVGRAVAVDGSGDVAVTGLFNGTVDFGGGNLTSAGGDDIFVVKFGANGHLWSRRYGSASDDNGIGIFAAGGGDVVVTGFFNGTVNFGGGNLVSAGNLDIFLLKLRK